MKSTILFLALVVAAAYAADWDYSSTGNKGPSNWKPSNVCQAKRQSPIDISMEDTSYDEALGHLKFSNYDNVHVNATYKLDNLGYTAVVNMAVNGKGNEIPSTVEFQGQTYRALQFHFHWGKDDTAGSEHTVNGDYYPAELHIVHYNTKYNFTSGEFMNKGDGLLVVGTFIKKGATHPSMNKLTNHFGRVTYAGQSFSILPFPLGEMLSTDVSTHFMHYLGSLTTPPCNEAVMWIVSRTPVTMDETQFAQFRALHAEGLGSTDPVSYVSGNYRPVMALHGRSIKRSFSQYVGSAATKLQMSTLMLPILMAIAYLF